MRRADGYYAQFCLAIDRLEEVKPTERVIALDVGLMHFYTDNQGNKVENPRHLRKSQKALGNNNFAEHLPIVFQPFKELSPCSIIDTLGKTTIFNHITHHQFLEHHQVVRLDHASCQLHGKIFTLARDFQVFSSQFGNRFFAFVRAFYLATYSSLQMAVPPQYTSQECSSCHRIVKKSLSERTHVCECGCILDRDENASRNLLAKGLEIISRGGHSRINAQGHLNLCQISESLLDKFGG